MHLVAYILVDYFKKVGFSDDKSKLHPLMQNSMAVLGISFMGHKKVENSV